MDSLSVSDKSRALLSVLALLGVIGAHRFYAGKVCTGIIMVLTIGGLGIWALIDLFKALTGEFADVKGMKIAKW